MFSKFICVVKLQAYLTFTSLFLCVHIFIFILNQILLLFFFLFLFLVHHSFYHLKRAAKTEIKHEFIDLLCLWSLAALWIARRHGWFVPKWSERKLASDSTAFDLFRCGVVCYVLCAMCLCLFYRVQWVLVFSSKSPYIIWHVFCFGKPINRLIAITFNTWILSND